MRLRHVLALVFLVMTAASCRQILGIEEAILICPPEMPDCRLCSDPNDCGPSTECHSWACMDALCTPVNTPARKSCAKGVCSDASPSECVSCVVGEDCPDPSNHCALGQCFRCDDGVQNGDESDVDCGGSCKGCLGDFCTEPDACASGFCADGRCCTSACTDTCAYCSLPSGSCSALPKYARDNDPQCGGQYACDGGGGCRLRSGEICTSAVQCASGRCVNHHCVNLPGEPCDWDAECAELSCVDWVCTM